MEKDISVSASELEKGAEGIRDALNAIRQGGKNAIHLITFNFNNQSSWFKVDLTKPEDVQVVFFNQGHRSMVSPLKVVFEEFLSQYPKGNLLDWDRHNRMQYSQRQILSYPNDITKEFVTQCPRIDASRYQDLYVLSTDQAKKIATPEPVPAQATSRFGFGFFGGSQKLPPKDPENTPKLK